MWAVHRIIKAPPLCKAPHHNCSRLPTSVFYLQAQNQVQHSQCDLGISVQGSSYFTWPGAILLVMQPQTAPAVCFKGTLPACGQSICWDLWEIPMKTQEKKVLQTWSAWGLLICVQSLNVPVQPQAYSLLILLLPIQWQKIALLSPTSLSTFNSRWALVFLTQSLCTMATIQNPSFAACCSSHLHSTAH